MKTNFGVRAFIFFPIYRESDKFKLFKFIPVPLKLSNKTLIEIDPTNNMLAVKFSQNDFVFKEMKEKDLKDCEVMKEQYVCQGNIYFKKSHASCLKSMYFQTRYKELLDDCKVFAKTAKRRVIKVAQNTFIFAFPETAYYNKICNGSVVSQKVKIVGVEKTFIENSCWLEFDDFFVKPSEGIEVEKQIKFAFFEQNASLFFGNFTEIQLDRIFDEARKIHISPKINPLTAEILRKINQRPWFAFEKDPQSSFNSLIIFSLLGSVFLTVFIFLCGKWKNQRSERGKQKFKNIEEHLELTYPFLAEKRNMQ